MLNVKLTADIHRLFQNAAKSLGFIGRAEDGSVNSRCCENKHKQIHTRGHNQKPSGFYWVNPFHT